MTTPIPNLPAVTPETWRIIPIHESREQLDDIQKAGVITDSTYAAASTDSPYHTGGLEGSTRTLFARKEVVGMLAAAQAMLPNDMGLVAMDSWRSFQVQQSLFNSYYYSLKQLHPDWQENDLLAESQKYVSLPSTNPACPSPHNTGGSVDVLVYQLPSGSTRSMLSEPEILQTATLLDTGVPFDHGGQESAVRYFEDNDAPNAEVYRRNRRLLYWAMIMAGFAAFPPEIWHYNYGNQMAAQANGSDFAIYGQAELSPYNQALERVSRSKHRERLISNFDLSAIIKPVD